MKTQTPRVSSKDVLELANFAGIFCDAYALNGNSGIPRRCARTAARSRA